jgi:hypothetical protein
MSTLAIFVLGLLVTGITLSAVFLVGLSEASDPAHSRLSDLSALEGKLVGRSRDENRPEADDRV